MCTTTTEIQNGCFFNLVIGAGVIMIGGLLSLTGIGAIIGIPLIIGGILYPIINIGSTSIIGSCPYCGHEVSASKKTPGVTCPACRQRIIIRNNMFCKII